MGRPDNRDALESCRKHIRSLSPTLYGQLEQLSSNHPILSDDLTFYMAMERLLIHMPPHYLSILREFAPEDLERANRHDVERAKFFCFRSRSCAFASGFLKKEYHVLKGRTHLAVTRMSPARLESCRAAASFFLAICYFFWFRMRPPEIVHRIVDNPPPDDVGENRLHLVRQRIYLL